MNSLFLLMKAFLTINAINCFSLSVRNRRSGPDRDSDDPIGSTRLRPVFLGKSSGIRDFSSHNTQSSGPTSLESQDFEGPEGPFEPTLPSELPELEEEPKTNEQNFGFPKSVIQQRIQRERLRNERIRNQHLIHPDSDALRGKNNRLIVDDPLPEMIAGGDLEANPYAEKTSFGSIIQQLLLESIGLQKK